MITQLNPPLPLETVKGPGWAHFVIDYGPECALLWVVFMDEDGACWTVPNAEVRMYFNWTMGRRKADDPTPQDVRPARRAAEAAKRASEGSVSFHPALGGSKRS